MYYLDKRFNKNKLFKKSSGEYEKYNYYFICKYPIINIYDSKYVIIYKDITYNMIIYRQDKYDNTNYADILFNEFIKEDIDVQERIQLRNNCIKEELFKKLKNNILD